MTLKIISAQQIEFEGEVTSVTLPGAMGKFQVLNNHAALIAADCLRNLQIQHIQQEINKMTELVKNASTAEKQAEALMEVTALSKELARLKQQGR